MSVEWNELKEMVQFIGYCVGIVAGVGWALYKTFLHKPTPTPVVDVTLNNGAAQSGNHPAIGMAVLSSEMRAMGVKVGEMADAVKDLTTHSKQLAVVETRQEAQEARLDKAEEEITDLRKRQHTLAGDVMKAALRPPSGEYPRPRNRTPLMHAENEREEE